MLRSWMKGLQESLEKEDYARWLYLPAPDKTNAFQALI